MKTLKHSLIIFSFLLFNYFSHGQNNYPSAAGEKYLMSLYHQWSHVNSDENKFHSTRSGDRITTSSFYPVKATNYTWNTTSSAWSIFDTTFYTYAGPDLIATITRKNSSNVFLTRVLNTFDANNFKIEAINQTWSSGWQNVSRDTLAYDGNSKIILQEYQSWISNQWQIASGSQYQYTYSGTGKILVKIAQAWNGTVWDTTSRFTNTYNANDQVSQTIRESYNTLTSSWSNTSKTNYIYDVSNVNIQTIDYSWNVPTSAWINNTQIINPVWALWTGDIATSKPSSYTYQTWSGSTWANSERLLSATYDSYGGSVETYQQFITGTWVNEIRNSLFIDNQYNKTGERDETWNVSVWDTTYEDKYLLSYDVNNSITQSIYQQFNITAHGYLNYFKTDYSDFIFVGIENISASENFSVSVFPNPMTEIADVVILSDKFIPAAYYVYDLTGQLISSKRIKEKHFRLNKDELTQGIYFLRISGLSGENASLKFIVQ